MSEPLMILFCLLYNIAIIVACIFMAFYISQGASLWLILIMFILCLCMGIPRSKSDKCPKCGYDPNKKESEQEE